MLALAACTQNVTEDKNVQDDITGESVSYIFITDLHLDTSEGCADGGIPPVECSCRCCK